MSQLPAKTRATTVSLVLGSGGARGYAHIGVIEELLEQGYEIRSVAGSSMGALVGGIFAAGRLDIYRRWACALTRYQVWRLVDLTFSGGGFIKGDRIIATLREMIGEVQIEHLPVRYTAVASDLDASREVWFTQGPLFDAIRASIAVPSIFLPVNYRGHLLVDGGLLNPVPISPTLGDFTDCTIAVDVNSADGAAGPEPAQQLQPEDPPIAAPPVADGESGNSYRRRISAFVDSLFDKKSRLPRPSPPGAIDLFARSLDTVQSTLTRFKLAAQPPDVLITVPRSACSFYEFDCAERMIELGRERARIALAANRRLAEGKG